MRFSPMPLATAREPFSDPDWLFEPKYDGFRALAYIDGHRCQLVSRRGNMFKSFIPGRRGVDFFRVACAHDLEGIVAKWRDGTYTSGPRTSWLKIRNPYYPQWEGRRELSDARSSNATRRQLPARPHLALL